MRPIANPATTTPATITRWTARALSGLILSFWGFFIIAHLVGDEGQASRPLNERDYIGLAAMGTWLVGLLAAWKWELAGGAMALVAVLVGGIANWLTFAFPGPLIAFTAALFIASWWLHGSAGTRRRAF
jgi:hypothetical protein